MVQYVPKRRKEKPLENIGLKELIKTAKDVLFSVYEDLTKVGKGNQQAAQRIRVNSLELEDTMKELRKRTLESPEQLKRIKRERREKVYPKDKVAPRTEKN